jgi:CO/xanthine dehydrogenase Mo-binding subunit
VSAPTPPATSFLTSRTCAAPDGFGKPVRRVEDARFITGGGSFSDDVNVPGQAYAAFVRSPHAHARIVRIDGAAALKIPGVIAVLTGADAATDGLRPIPHIPIPTNPHELKLQSRRLRAVRRSPYAIAGGSSAPGG